MDTTNDPAAAKITPEASPAPTSWLPPDFEHPTHVPLSSGYHLRPIAETDVDLDMIAVMGSRSRLWDIYGKAWGGHQPT